MENGQCMGTYWIDQWNVSHLLKYLAKDFYQVDIFTLRREWRLLLSWWVQIAVLPGGSLKLFYFRTMFQYSSRSQANQMERLFSANIMTKSSIWCKSIILFAICEFSRNILPQITQHYFQIKFPLYQFLEIFKQCL